MVPFAVVVGIVFLRPEKRGIVLNCFGRLTQDWSLMTLTPRWSGASSEWSVLLTCSLGVYLERGSGVLASCEQVAPIVDLERGPELHAETLTSLHHHLVSQSGWRKPSSPLQAGCKAELGTEPHSSWWHCTSGGVCTEMSDLQPADECEHEDFFTTIGDFG